MHYFSNLFNKVLHVLVSDRSTVHHQEYLNTVYKPTELAWRIPIACIQCWDIPDDGQWIYPKQVRGVFYQINLRNSASPLFFIIKKYVVDIV
jgi:hypothetical protein